MNIASFVDCVQFAIETCEEGELSGNDKLVLSLSILREAITRSKMSLSDKNLCSKILCTGILGNMVTLVVSSSKKKVNINRRGWRRIFKKK